MRRFGLCLIIALAAAGNILGGEVASQDKSAYLFTFNGKPCAPQIISMQGDPTHPQPGDLVLLHPFWLRLGQERACHFTETSREDGRIFLQLANGEKRVVGASVTWTYKDDKWVVFNPLAKMSAEEIHGLWGVYLADWPKGIAEKLKHIDPARTCLALSGTVVDNRNDGKLPSLPRDIQYLAIDDMGIKDYEALRGLSSLQFLTIRAMTAKAFDAGLIAQNKSLRYLNLKMRRLENSEALAQLDKIEHLDLAYIPNLAAVGFAAKMADLRQLNVGFTAVKDLSPLIGLKKLEKVVASGSPVEKLPDAGIPSLQTLDVLSTKLSDSTVAAFAKLNPKCIVRFRWSEALRQVVAGANRLRIRSGGTCHRMPSKEKTLWELTDAAKVQEFAALIVINEKQSGDECMCCGDPTFEFYEGKRLIAMLGFHHGIRLRWADGCWPGDGQLTQESEDRLPKWLAKNGFDSLQKAREAAEAEKRRRNERRQAFLNCYPESVRKLFDENLSPMDDGEENQVDDGEENQGKRIAKVIGQPVDVAVATCRALGTADGSWSSTDNYQRLAIAAGQTVGGEDFQKALERIRNDRVGEIGAARMFFWSEYDQKINPADRIGWTVYLAKIVLDRGSVDNKPMVMRHLASLKDAKIADLLRQIARGEVGQDDERNGEEPGLRTSAYLALATQGDAGIKPEVEKLLATTTKRSDRAALEVSLALLGDPKYIKPEHFRLQSYTIGLAAIRAIENFSGREGMNVLVEVGFEHPWAAVNDEAILTVQRITGQTWCKDPKHERASRYRKDAEKWWRENGATFIKKCREKNEQPHGTAQSDARPSSYVK